MHESSDVFALFPPLCEALRARHVRLRYATDRDGAFLRELHGESLAFLGDPTDADRAAIVEQQFRFHERQARKMHPDGLFLTVAQRADGCETAIGRLSLDISAPVWQLLEIRLQAAIRGDGIGSALVRWVQNAALLHGARCIELHVEIGNRGARRLYERLGFIVVDDGADDGEHRSHHRMSWTPYFAT